MSPADSPGSQWRLHVAVSVCAGLALWCYWSTAAHVVTWWEGTSWVMTAQTLGVTFPPGSLLLTFFGWLISKIPLGLSVPFQLNLFGGIIAVGVVAFLFYVPFGLTVNNNAMTPSTATVSGTARIVSATSAVLAFALGWTPWRYANKFSPYMLTALMTMALVWAMLRWWHEEDRSKAAHWLALMFFLFGLDFSIHRTNLLLLPGAVMWILLRDARAFLRVQNWLLGIAALLVGLSAHLGIMALALRHPIVNANDPSTWSRFYDYVSLKQFGGGWLVSLWPRQGPFWNHQVRDWVNAFAATFADFESPLGGVGLLPLILGLVGIIALWRRSRRLTAGLILLFLCAGMGGVIYFNLPEQFPWPMDRHYLPSFALFAILMIVGAVAAVHWALRLPGTFGRTTQAALVVILMILPINQWLRNREIVDQSRDLYAYEFAGNILNFVEPNAIVVIQGDNLWPVWHRNAVEGLRPDVTVLSLSLLNAGWYVRQMLELDPRLPLALTDEELRELGPEPWTEDSLIWLSVPPTGSTAIHAPTPAFQNYVLAQDRLLVEMIRNSAWKRPLYFTDVPPWLTGRCDIEGVVARLAPFHSVMPDCECLRTRLMRDYQFSAFEAGKEGTQGTLAWMTESVAQRYALAFALLGFCERREGNPAGAQQATERARSLFPESKSP